MCIHMDVFIHVYILAYVYVKTWTCWNTHEYWHRCTFVHEVCVCICAHAYEQIKLYILTLEHMSGHISIHTYSIHLHIHMCLGAFVDINTIDVTICIHI